MSDRRILLRGGIVLQHKDDDSVEARHNTDVLISGDTIVEVGQNIKQDNVTHLLECSGKIISPGFIDTHHHVWQTQLRGRHSDDTLLDYTFKGNLQPFNYRPEDIFWGELGGLLEGLDNGTTTVVDHAHMVYSPDHGSAGLSATITSGIRSFFCYSLIARMKRWDDKLELDEEFMPEWFVDQLRDFCGRQPFGNGRVHIGLGFDLYASAKDKVIDLFNRAREYGARPITSHWRKNILAGSAGPSVPQTLHDYNILGPDVILSHATGSSERDFELLRSSKAYISCTPSTESQMAHGEVVGFKEGVFASLGTDCHSNNPGSMFDAMRVGLAVARSHNNSRLLAQSKFPARALPSTLQAFNLATICGARAVGMADKIGSIAVGKLADLVIIDGNSPGTVCATQHDPLVSVVRHASTADVKTVFVGGVARKYDGSLVDVELSEEEKWNGYDRVKEATGSGRLTWRVVAQELVKSRERVQRRIDESSMQAGREFVLAQMGTPNGVLTEP